MKDLESSFEYILFDLDGTLTDPKEGITKSVQYALHSFGIEEPELKVLEPFIGPPLRDSFVEFYGFSEEEAKQAVVKYRERFQVTGLYENKIYPGIPRLLARLQKEGKHLAVASSKPQVFVEKILTYFKIDQYFEVVVGSELNGGREKKEEVVEEALRQLFKNHARMLEKTVMVGDRKFDVQGGRKAGLKTIGVSYGYAGKGELEEAGADYIAGSVRALENLLRKKKEKKSSFEKTWYVLSPLIFYYLGSQFSYLILAVFFQFTLQYAGEEYAGYMMGHAGAVQALVKGVTMLIGMGFVWKMFQEGYHGKGLKGAAPSYLFLCVLAVTFSICLNLLANRFGFLEISDRFTQTAQQQYAVPVLIGILLYGLAAPFVEEVVFRGLIFTRLKQYFPVWTAVGVSAVIFGGYHGNLVQGVYAFIQGLLMAYVFQLYGTLTAPVLFHAAANISVFLLTYYFKGMDVLAAPVNIIMLGMLSCLSLLFMIRMEKKY